MDVFGILEFLNGLGLPLPLCVILVVFLAWLYKLNSRVGRLEDLSHDFAKKDQFKKYVRCDICDKNISHINLSNKLGESLKAQRINQLDDRVDDVERQLKGVKRHLFMIYEKLKAKGFF